MDDNQEQEYGAVLIEVFLALKSKMVLILVAALAAGMLGWGVSGFLLTPRYEASVNMIVNTRTEVTGVITSDNISSAENLVDTYAIIIKSNKVLNKVIEQLHLDVTYEALYDAVSVSAINDTQVMKIAVEHEERARARQIVEAIVQIAPDMVKDAVEAGSCKVVSDVHVEKDPVFPNVKMITVLAAAMGMMLTMCLVVLKELLNDFIVDDLDVERKIGLPVLGIIPDMEEK